MTQVSVLDPNVLSNGRNERLVSAIWRDLDQLTGTVWVRKHSLLVKALDVDLS